MKSSSFLLFFSLLALVVALLQLAAKKRYGNYSKKGNVQEQARRLRSQLSLDEKISLLHGTKGPYIGNVAALPQRGVPAIKMNDGPQGFRGPDGTSTAWPCTLSMAATWDEDLVDQWGVAMAEEFRDKGANVWLGPGVNVARVPTNGRNFEYLSGEDPMLGSKLVAALIRGAQKQPNGIIACVKHFVHNNQETERSQVNAVVDDRTHWELYMPPFEAAVAAGVLSVMCSYNRVNGDYACEQATTLNADLKQTLGFRGFVVSDWGATHSTVKAATAGLDMEMPGDKFFGDELKEAVLSGHVPMDVMNDMVDRVLYALIASGAIDQSSTGSIDANVTSVHHNHLAREFAAAGIVLLKNENNILPLGRDNCNIVVIGDTLSSGGGSGHVDGPYVISGFQGIQDKCQQGSNDSRVKYLSMDNPDMQVVQEADVVVIFTSTTSSEGKDRENLSFPTTELKVIDAVVSVASNMVVVGTAPGAVLFPFAENISGLLLTFMPGQEAGNAIADILFGDTNPSGKLPLTIPNVENEVEFTTEQYPGINHTALYTEKLLVGYRWYNANNVQPKFPFGYGLSYTQFSYSSIEVTGRSIHFNLTNIGMREGSEVAQLYLSFPATTGNPPKCLKQFQKVFLKAGDSTAVWFQLSSRDFSVWNSQLHDWEEVGGIFGISVGSSSTDLPLRANTYNQKDTTLKS
jgi:beta-glucosidase